MVPVYNEIGCLDPLVERVRGALDSAGIDWELVLVDDGSTDGSGEKMDELAAADERDPGASLRGQLRPDRGSGRRVP